MKTALCIVVVLCVALIGNASANAAPSGASLSASYNAEQAMIALKGTAFPVAAEVKVDSDFAGKVVSQTAMTNTSGAFEMNISVPAGFSGSVHIIAHARVKVSPTTSSVVGNGADQSATALPSYIVGDYWTTWGGFPISQFKSQAPGYNVHYAAFATSAAAGSGKVAFDPGSSGSNLTGDIAANKAQGGHWLLSVGGAEDGGIHLANEANVDEMIQSLVPIIDKYKFEGVDWDLEAPTSKFDNGAIALASRKLKQHYGKAFAIQFTLGPFATDKRDLVAKNADAFDLLGYMFYCDDLYYDDAQARQEITKTVNDAIAAGVPASKILVGAMVGSNEAHAKASVYVDTYKELKAQHNDLRGMFSWETTIDRDSGWSFINLASK